MRRASCVIVIIGTALVGVGMLSLAPPPAAVGAPVVLDRAAMLTVCGAEGGCERKEYPYDCWRRFSPTSPQCTTGEPVIDCTIEIGGCGVSICSTDCTALPNDHYDENGDRWGHADCRFDCWFWGSTYDIRLCAWIDTLGMCKCWGPVQSTGWGCPRGNYCKFFEE